MAEMPPSPSSPPPGSLSRARRPEVGASSLGASSTDNTSPPSSVPRYDRAGLGIVRTAGAVPRPIFQPQAQAQTQNETATDEEMTDAPTTAGASSVDDTGDSDMSTGASDSASDSDSDSDGDEGGQRSGSGGRAAAAQDIGMLLDPTARAPGRASARAAGGGGDEEEKRRRRRQRKSRRQRRARESLTAASGPAAVDAVTAEANSVAPEGQAPANAGVSEGPSDAQRSAAERERRRLVHQDFQPSKSRSPVPGGDGKAFFRINTDETYRSLAACSGLYAREHPGSPTAGGTCIGFSTTCRLVGDTDFQMNRMRAHDSDTIQTTRT